MLVSLVIDQCSLLITSSSILELGSNNGISDSSGEGKSHGVVCLSKEEDSHLEHHSIHDSRVALEGELAIRAQVGVSH